jgi:hypothetical protein
MKWRCRRPLMVSRCAIGLRPYVVDDLASGRLVAPFTVAVPKGKPGT